MHRPIRSVETYYENGPTLHISHAFASAAFAGASDILQAYVPVHLKPPGRIDLPMAPDATLDYRTALLNGATHHEALLTRRQLKAADDTTLDRYEGMHYGYVSPTYGPRTAVFATVTGDPTEQNLDLVVGRLVHEFGHSFDLGHCALPACVMAPTANHANLIQAAVSPDTLFCDDHAQQLEQSGWVFTTR